MYLFCFFLVRASLQTGAVTLQALKKGNKSLLKESETAFNYCTTFLLGTPQHSPQGWSDLPAPGSTGSSLQYLICFWGFFVAVGGAADKVDNTHHRASREIKLCTTTLNTEITLEISRYPLTYSSLKHISPQHILPTELHCKMNSLLDTASRLLTASLSRHALPFVPLPHHLPAPSLIQTICAPLWVTPPLMELSWCVQRAAHQP